MPTPTYPTQHNIPGINPFVQHNYPGGIPPPEIVEAAQLNNSAHELSRQGDFSGAEKLHLRALELKIQAVGEHSVQVAMSRNALGELYMKMEGRLDDSMRMLVASYGVLSQTDNFDAACSRDSQGRLWELKGDVVKAREIREEVPGRMVCANYNCPKTKKCLMSERSELKCCGKCKASFYCGRRCQRVDWKERHKGLCKESVVLEA